MNDNQISRYSELSLQMLKESGWYPGRNVLDNINLPSKFQIFPAATKVLQEFGYLCVGQTGPGITCIRSTVVFDPMEADGEDDRFLDWSTDINSPLYPLGSIDDCVFFLAIDQLGRTFLVMEGLVFLDVDFTRALDKLLIGIDGVYVENENDILDAIENHH